MNKQSTVWLRSLQATSLQVTEGNNRLLHGKAPYQSGMVLIISLIMLLLLTLIATTGMQTSSLEEKMAGNLRDRNIAFQAAESALRDAEWDIKPINPPPAAARDISSITLFVADCGASTTASTTDDGLCYNGPAGYSTSIWTTANMTAAPSVAYGRFTGATVIPNLSAQPRYLIEGFFGQTYYRITVRAQGANANTVVWLQEVFNP